VPRRTSRKYGDRGYRYLLLEAGHVAQNVVLTANALGLATCCGGGFLDDELAGLLLADIEHEVPVYAIAVGTPAPLDRTGLRSGHPVDPARGG
jgi:SagB-type dehydrogenase family enzyme